MRIIPKIAGNNLFWKTRRLAALSLAITMTLLITSCGNGELSDKLSDEPGHGKWVDSDLRGAVKADDEIRLQDDFAAAANQKTISEHQLDENDEDAEWSALDEVTDLMQSRYREVLKDESITGPNAEVLRTFENLVLDWDERNKLGIEPIRKYIDDIQSIKSIDELTEYQASLEKNPFNFGLIMPKEVQPQAIRSDKSTLVLKVSDYSLGSSDNYKEYSSRVLELKEINDGIITYLLESLGYDEKSIKDTIKGCYAVEQFLATNECMNLYDNYEKLNKIQTDREGIEQYTNGYPLLEILDGRGFSEVDSFNVDYMLLGKLHKIYDQDHLKDLKSFFTVRMLRFGYMMLDHDTIANVFEIGKSRSEKDSEEYEDKSDDQEFYTMVKDCSFMPAMDEVYLEKYYSDESKIDEIRNFIDGLKKSYSTMIYEEDWLSDEAKATAVKKLDNMIVHVVKPSNKADYSAVTVKSYDEGGNILDAAASAARLLNEHTALKASSPDIDREYWDIYEKGISTTEVNCMYSPQNNSFYIMAGWVAVGDVIFGDDITNEEFMGCVGVVAGHEISHGFDGNGSHYDLYGRKYDDEGNENDWMSTEDRSRLDERVGRAGMYFSLARPIPGKRQVTGYSVQNEATADMAGIKAILYMARDIDGFDYDGFFRGYAAVWAMQTPEKFELEQMETDNHPLGFHRINITLQQFDEFIDTYDIKPGDGMYLEPEKRINVW